MSLTVLVSLHQGYGLGDAVQVSAVLRHVAKYRPEWKVDYQAPEGQHQVGRGIVANTLAYGQPYPSPRYDAEVQICLYDTFANWGDRPNTRVSSCLHETFNLPWDPECGRYRVDVRAEVAEETEIILNVIEPREKSSIVALHYQGDSSKSRKDLSHDQAAVVCRHVGDLGRVPLLLDYRNMSPLRCDFPTMGGSSFSREWGRNAEYQCAVIRGCAAFVGIDSGPSKCASSTDTPALVVWTGHSPLPFHDPADNTTHLIPRGYEGLYPVVDDRRVIDWFESHYNFRWYDGDPVVEINRWLEETLK